MKLLLLTVLSSMLLALHAREYDPLPNSASIRLLRIQHSGFPVSEQLCSLEVFDLSDAPPYRALSYTCGPSTWTVAANAEGDGDLPQIHQFFCGQLTFNITENLYDGLQRLRALHEVEYLWIDQISINQNDADERASQVALMGKIFTSSVSVFVWLGKDDEYQQRIAWAIERILPKIRLSLAGLAIPTSQILEAITQAAGQHQFQWADFNFYATNRWLSRTWIVQEITLSRSVTVLGGQVQFSWEDFAELSSYYHSLLSLVDLRLDIPSPWHLDQAMRSMASAAFWRYMQEICSEESLEMRQSSWSKSHLSSLAGRKDSDLGFSWVQSILLATRQTQCLRSHDKVFALLGVADCLLSQPLRSFINLDYNGPISSLYVSVTRIIIERTRDLSILSTVMRSSQSLIENLPTWVPDFSRGITGETLPSQIRQFEACRGCEVSFDFSTDGKIGLQGALFDQIETLASDVQSERHSRTPKFLQDLTFACSHHDSLRQGPKLDVFWKTLITGPSELYSISPASNPQQEFRDWALVQFMYVAMGHDSSGKSSIGAIERLLSQCDDSERLPSTTDILRLATSVLYPYTEAPKDMRSILFQPVGYLAGELSAPMSQLQLQPYTAAELYRIGNNAADFSSAIKVSASRRLVKSGRGLLGLGPPLAESRDQIWVLKGHQVPVLLRGVGVGEYQLVGDCYFYRYMYGEMLAEEYDWKGRWRNITIV